MANRPATAVAWQSYPDRTRRFLAVVVCMLAWQMVPSAGSHAAPRCQPTIQAAIALPGRVDSLLATGTGAVMALVGRPGSSARFLPHDALEVGRVEPSGTSLRAIPVPPYLAPPGLAARRDGRWLYALVDATLLTIDGTAGHLIARQDLGLQAIGWPAAIATGTDGDLYLVGQPAGAMEAQVYALRPDARHRARLLWHTALGLTHAGTWIGPAGDDRIAVYLPDQHDAQGEVALLDLRRGLLRRSYAVPLPPIAASVSSRRLYLAGAGSIRAVALDTGAPVATVPGDAPFAASANGLVAFVRAAHLVVARGGDLRTLLTLGFPNGSPPTALAWQGQSLLVGTARGIIRIWLEDCTS